ncbi:MAG: hypothetical protein R3E66_02495 [bacterium]
MKQTLVTYGFCLFALAGGCAMEASDAASEFNANNQQPKSDAAQSKLFARDIQGARVLYTDALAADPNNPSAAAGKAVTDLLLLPYSSSFTAVITNSLGASRALNATRDVIYGDGGLLYLLVRGVPFADGDSFQGIASLLEADLPWTSRQMTSATDFVAELDKPVNDLWSGLEVVADDLADVERNLDVAIGSDAFTTYFLPGEVFHDQNLNLVMGKSELAAIRTVVSGVRAAVYFVGAYDFDWSLADAFGAQWDNVAPEDPGYQADWLYEDYVIDFMSPRLFRAVVQPKRLEKAGTSLAQTAHGIAQTLRLGEQNAKDTVLSWSQADADLVTELATLADSVGDAVSGTTPVPYTTPQTSMNLSSFFTAPGRVVDGPWFEYATLEDEFGPYQSWQLVDATAEAFLVNGVMDPEFDYNSPPDLELTGDAAQLTTDVSGDFTGDVESAYFSGR